MSVKEVRTCDQCGKDITSEPRFELAIVTLVLREREGLWAPERHPLDFCSPMCLRDWAQNYGH